MTTPTAPTSTISRRVFVLADAGEKNSNKYWEGHLEQAGVRCKWGRMGGKGQEKFYPGEGVRQLDARIREKTGKGYKEVALIEQRGAAPASALDSRTLAKVAQEQIAQGDEELAALVKRLAEANRHEIVKATGGAITFDADGLAKTALGIVQRSSIREARFHLSVIAAEQAKSRLSERRAMEAISAYMQLVPQKVGARRGWHIKLLGTVELIEEQYELLDKLEQSLTTAEEAVDALIAESAAHGVAYNVFEVKLSRVTDPAELARISRFFNEGVNRMHDSQFLRIKAVYALEIPTMRAAFEADGRKVGGIQELWHGTRLYNVLSILKSGLVIPRPTDGHVNGRMFGDGLYFSDQSTKSANYSAGYWDRSVFGRRADRNCFMFLADVAMGRAFVPPGRVKSPPAGYDSVFAKGNVSSVRNNEMIVYRLGQANLKYLLELEG